MSKQVGVKCSRGLIPHSECRKCALTANHPCMLTPDILEMMRDEEGGDTERGEYSPTKLLACDRRGVLEESDEWYVNIENSWALIRGTITHAGMENIKAAFTYPGALQVIREFRFSLPVTTKYGTFNFTGKPDSIVILLMEQDSETIHIKIIDYKTKGDISHEFVAAYPEHQMQINLYSYLAVKCLPDLLGLPTLQVVTDELEIMYIGFKKPRRFSSLTSLETKGKRLTKPVRYETLELEPLKRYRMEDMEKWVAHKIEAKIEAKTKLPPILEEPHNWVCDYCPVKERCYEIG